MRVLGYVSCMCEWFSVFIFKNTTHVSFIATFEFQHYSAVINDTNGAFSVGAFSLIQGNAIISASEDVKEEHVVLSSVTLLPG